MVRLLVRDRETIQEAVRRFRKLVERSGLKKEMRRPSRLAIKGTQQRLCELSWKTLIFQL